MVNNPQGYKRLVHLWFGQEGSCAVCAQKITRQSGWATGRLVRRTSENNRHPNLGLLNPACHLRCRRPTPSLTAGPPTTGAPYRIRPYACNESPTEGGEGVTPTTA